MSTPVNDPTTATPADGTDRNGTLTWQSVTQQEPCVICGKPDWCRRDADGRYAYCHRLAQSPTYGAGTNRGDGYIYRLRPGVGAGSWPEPKHQVADGNGELATPDERDAVYSLLVRHCNLSSDHRQALRSRGLKSSDLAVAQGCRTLGADRAKAVHAIVTQGLEHLLPRVPGFRVSEKNGRRFWSFGGSGGLMIPVRDAQERIVAILVRPDKPGPGGGKYVWASSKRFGGPGPGCPTHVPLFGGDRGVVRVTEGALKAMLATLLSGVWTIGLSSTSVWRRAAKALREIGATAVRVAFDADWRTNPAVAGHLAKLVDDLRDHGFVVELELWDAADGKGIDDLLAAGNTPEVVAGDAIDRVLAAIEATATPPEVADAAASTDEPGVTVDEKPPRYFVAADGMYFRDVKATAQGAVEEIKQLTNFTATIVEEERLDDGDGGAEIAFRVQGELRCQTEGERERETSPLAPVSILAAEFAALTWVATKWGAAPRIEAGHGIKDHARAAIQFLSPPPRRRRVFRHTGWATLDGGERVYLSAAGAIGAAGEVADVAVRLESPADRYRLTLPTSPEDLRACVAAALDLYRAVPAHLAVPLFGAVFRAPLGPCDFSVFLVGSTGQGKSELLGLIQQFYGCDLGRRSLPGSWSSTDNALEATAFALKDAAFVIDDFKPAGDRFDDELCRKADRVLRAQGNRSGRARLAKDLSTQAARYPRGLILCSGEDLPRGESLRARFWAPEVRKGDVVGLDLTAHLRAADAGVFASCLGAFVRWLAANYGEMAPKLKAEAAELRETARAGGHARMAGIHADLFLGVRYFFDFAVASGAIAACDAQAALRDAWATLCEEHQNQVAGVANRDPVQRFLALVNALVASGRSYLQGRDGGPPSDAERWGYRAKIVGREGEIEFAPAQSTSQCVGFVDGDDLYLIPETAFGEAARLAEASGQPMAVSDLQLRKRLAEARLIVSNEIGKLTQRRTLGGGVRSVLHLRTDSVFGGANSPDSPGGKTEPGDENRANSKGKSDHSPGSPDSPGYLTHTPVYARAHARTHTCDTPTGGVSPEPGEPGEPGECPKNPEKNGVVLSPGGRIRPGEPGELPSGAAPTTSPSRRKVVEL